MTFPNQKVVCSWLNTSCPCSWRIRVASPWIHGFAVSPCLRRHAVRFFCWFRCAWLQYDKGTTKIWHKQIYWRSVHDWILAVRVRFYSCRVRGCSWLIHGNFCRGFDKSASRPCVFEDTAKVPPRYHHQHGRKFPPTRDGRNFHQHNTALLRA